jgi:hypothetical protein
MWQCDFNQKFKNFLSFLIETDTDDDNIYYINACVNTTLAKKLGYIIYGDQATVKQDFLVTKNLD